jgi:Ca-activated chloride channel homolog
VRLLHPWALLLFIALPFLYWLSQRADFLKSADLRRFTSRDALAPSKARTRYFPLIALGLTVVAIVQPTWRTAQYAHSGLDVVFLLDVSRSMLTRDTGQTRIGHARELIAQVVAHAANERFGLVVFAGDASLECPLTNDYVFLRDQLKRVSRDSVTLGGTRLGDAIRFSARSAFDDASRNARELVLVTDGDDEASSPNTAAGELNGRGIQLIVIGVGNTSGAFVPKSESDPTPMLYEGKPVLTKLDSATLQRICAANVGCQYLQEQDREVQETVLRNSSKAGNSFTEVQPVAALLSLVAAALLGWERFTT